MYDNNRIAFGREYIQASWTIIALSIKYIIRHIAPTQ